ncbi:MAG: hypothetical protein COV00_02400 [Candidatus Tagabacteria bacterium CG10_big_fil_rev_8_21_14_0_10_40_13]|uniref:Glycosyltransferase RgtA/B/C/D-like domain-containing protein n=1 Tax=Candidatus Tagabacteria bacterium CG10_big_fil_rev_8_21_14_0_10_40_13 TaxID=1975022 RepID=A0A2M8L8S4_9BACT|nr:MAG: hypothetical protein COV00_02400 [Candidatus Tagabacteria bacterium CG10_big_fil_rev_8_21_14_0_10_40_13]
MAKKQIFIFLFIILAVAGFFRLWQITDYPPGLYPDEAMNANNALEAMENGDYKWFYSENNGREGLYINLLAIPLFIFGNEPWALRLLSAIFGILTILGLYLLAKELFKNERLALFASFFMAVSFWHIIFSRIAFRPILAPFFLTWAFYLLFKITNRINWKLEIGNWKLITILSGLLFGLGFHTYIAYRVTPLLLIIPFALLWKNNKKVIVVFLLGAFIAGLPLGWYFLNNPADFLGRTSQISIFSVDSPLKALAENVFKTIGMLFWAGDYNWRHNLSGTPELFWPVAVLFLIGIMLGFAKIFNFQFSIFNKFSIFKPSIYFLLSWLIIMSLPVVISSEGIPHALRAIILIPPIMILAALGLESIIDKINKWHTKKLQQYPQNAKQLGRIKKQLAVLLFAFLLLIASHCYIQYFLRWAPNIHTQGAFNARYVEIGNYLNNLPKESTKYVVINADGVLVREIPMPSQTVMFITNTYPAKNRQEKNIHYVLPENISAITCPENCSIITLENDTMLREEIKKQTKELTLKISPQNIEVLEKF